MNYSFFSLYIPLKEEKHIDFVLYFFLAMMAAFFPPWILLHRRQNSISTTRTNSESWYERLAVSLQLLTQNNASHLKRNNAEDCCCAIVETSRVAGFKERWPFAYGTASAPSRPPCCCCCSDLWVLLITTFFPFDPTWTAGTSVLAVFVESEVFSLEADGRWGRDGFLYWWDL